MDETILITGNQSPVSLNLAKKYLSEGYNVVVTLDQEADKLAYASVSDDAIDFIRFDRRSPIAAKALFLDFQNRSCEFQNIFYVVAGFPSDQTLHNLLSNEIEGRIDSDLKGYVFFAKEAVKFFEKSHSTSINTILYNPGQNVAGPLDAAIQGGIEQSSNALFAYYNQSALQFRGFISHEHQVDDFVNFIFSSIVEGKSTGKWHVHRNRGRFFHLGKT